MNVKYYRNKKYDLFYKIINNEVYRYNSSINNKWEKSHINPKFFKSSDIVRPMTEIEILLYFGNDEDVI